MLIYLLPSKPLPKNIKNSDKYNKIKVSITEVGLVEPIVVYPCKSNDGYFNIIDGHMRVESLRDLKVNSVPCLIATFEDTFSYNKRVIRLSAIQEHKMILNAVKSGVPIKRLSEVLGISEKTIKSKFNLLDGICQEVSELLADKNVPSSIFRMLKKMKPLRQIEVVTSMNSLGQFSLKFVESMLNYTPDNMLVNIVKKSDPDKIEAFKKLQNELSVLDGNKKELQENYSENNLRLVIIKSHILKMLENSKVINWLYDNENDYLKQLKHISSLQSL
jgi:hypothetical protein